jgi:hypothetical protein
VGTDLKEQKGNGRGLQRAKSGLRGARKKEGARASAGKASQLSSAPSLLLKLVSL